MTFVRWLIRLGIRLLEISLLGWAGGRAGRLVPAGSGLFLSGVEEFGEVSPVWVEGLDYLLSGTDGGTAAGYVGFDGFP